MTSEQSSSTNISFMSDTFSTIPQSPSQSVQNSAIYNMSGASSTPSLISTFPTAAMASMSLGENNQATPTPKDKKSRSESSLRTITPPNNTRGASLVNNGTNSESNNQIFVKSQEDDDVFGRSSNSSPNEGSKSQSTTGVAIAKVQANLATPVSLKQNPRPDRMNSPITPANAQGVLPPEACVFVANLATSRSDDQLEVACHDHFDVFGNCHIKVRRDKHRHPFALVQYYSIEDANNAIRSSRDIVIDGRNIRTEHAQARRSVVLTRVGGGAVSEEEAREALVEFGPIAQMHPTTNSDARDLGLPEGMWVQFAFYLDYKDCLKSFNSTSIDYRIHVPPEVEARTHPGPSGSPIIKGFRTPRSTTDQKSIFVGNLPPETTEHHLKQMFSSCGMIRAVNIIHKPIHGGPGFNVFGFVEFSTVSEAESAANMEVEINNCKIRVEPKEYSARRHTRLQQYTPNATPYYRSPRSSYNHTYSGQHQGMPMSYNNPFYNMQSPSQVMPGSEMGSFHHHHHHGFNSVYNTPPPSARMPRRGNEMLYTGSPHHMTPWSPAPYITASGYAGGMMQIPEELEGQGY